MSIVKTSAIKDEEENENEKRADKRKAEEDDEEEVEEEEEEEIKLNKSLTWYHPSMAFNKNNLFSNEKTHLKPISYSTVPTIISTSISTSIPIGGEFNQSAIGDILNTSSDPVRDEVVGILTKMIFSVARSLRADPYPARPKLPDPFQPKSELEVIIPKGRMPLSMHLGKYHDHPVVLGFRILPSGAKGPAEATGISLPVLCCLVLSCLVLCFVMCCVVLCCVILSHLVFVLTCLVLSNTGTSLL